MKARHSDEKKRIIEVVVIIAITFVLLGLSKLETKLFEIGQTLTTTSDFAQALVYFGLININVVLILILSFLIFRNIAKLVLDRKRGVLGSSLRAKLIMMLVLFALAPTVLFFYISSSFITNSFDTWFSSKIRETIRQTSEVGAKVYKQDQRRLASLARIGLRKIKINEKKNAVINGIPHMQVNLRGFEREYRVHSIKVYDALGSKVWDSERTVSEQEEQAQLSFVLDAIQKFSEEPTLDVISLGASIGETDVVKGIAPIYYSDPPKLVGVVMTEERFETQILQSIKKIEQSFIGYKPSAELIRYKYTTILILMTLIIFFSATWLGFVVSKGIVGPIQKLAEATREVALGNYGVSIKASGGDEAGQLVRAFNRMTRDLRSHQAQNEEASYRLEKINEELDARGRYMSVVLRNINTSVLSFDARERLTSINKAAENLLKIKGPDLIGKKVSQALPLPFVESVLVPVKSQLETADNVTLQLDVEGLGEKLTLLIDATKLTDEQGIFLGTVMVFDDATEQVKVQKVAAWREVARRIAHEIKNPITPIKLNAQRMLRKFDGYFSGEDQEVFISCIEAILGQVDALRGLVNEFSKFARLPAVNKKVGHIGDVVGEVVKFYQSSYSAIDITAEVDESTPQFPFDAEQMNRVFVNIVSNSIAALKDEYAAGERGYVKIHVTYLAEPHVVRIDIKDNGWGIPDDIKDKVIEPYFSTKDEGTGLGLAIVNQIVTDHGGYLRIFDNAPSGAHFSIELPSA